MERLEGKTTRPISQLLSSLALPHYQRVCCKYCDLWYCYRGTTLSFLHKGAAALYTRKYVLKSVQFIQSLGCAYSYSLCYNL